MLNVTGHKVSNTLANLVKITEFSRAHKIENNTPFIRSTNDSDGRNNTTGFIYLTSQHSSLLPLLHYQFDIFSQAAFKFLLIDHQGLFFCFV